MSLRFRRGTQAEFDAGKSNILAGEPAFTTDEKRFFIGGSNGSPVEFLSLKYLVSLTPNASRTLNIPTDFHGILFGFGFTVNMAMYMIASASTGTYVNATEISNNSDSTITIGSGTITITNTGAGNLDLYYSGTGVLSYS